MRIIVHLLALVLMTVAVAAAVLFVTPPASAQETRSKERAFLAQMISYSKTGITSRELVRKAIEFDPDVAAATRAATNVRAGGDALQRKRADAAARVARQQVARVALIAWADAIGARRKLLTLQKLTADNEKVLALAEAMPAGEARDEFIRELKTEQARVRAMLITTEAAFNTSSSQLAAILDTSIASPIDVNTTFELEALKQLPSDVEELVERAIAARPDLLLAHLDEEAAQAEFLHLHSESEFFAEAARLGFHRVRADHSGPGPAEATQRRRHLERMIRTDVESAFANFVASQQVRSELEPVLLALRQKYASGDLSASQVVLEERQRYDVEMQIEQTTATLMRAGIDLVISLGIEP